MEIATKTNIDNLQNQITEGLIGGGQVKLYKLSPNQTLMDGNTYKVRFPLPDSLRVNDGIRALAVLKRASGRTSILNFNTAQGVYSLTGGYTLSNSSSSSASIPRPDSDGNIWVWQANNSEQIQTLFVTDLFSWPQA